MTSGVQGNSSARFPGLDGIRALAILLVMAWHSLLVTKVQPEDLGVWATVARAGWAGVDVFFALSGFLITTLILREEDTRAAASEPPGFSLRRFYLRRALRILPVFYFVFLVNLFVLSGIIVFPSVTLHELAQQASPLAIVPYATFWGNYFWTYGGQTSPGEAIIVYWSLCVEEHFYLLWPAFLALVRGHSRRVGVALAVCIGMLGARAIFAAGHLAHPLAIHYLSHFRIDSILWGAVGALVSHRSPLPARPRRAALIVTSAGSVTMLVTGQLSLRPAGTALGASVGLTLLAIAATLLVLEVAAGPQSLLARGLDIAPLRAIGRVSYGMYLIHFQAIDIGILAILMVTGNFAARQAPWAYAVYVVVAVVLASFIYRFIETPFLRLKDRRFGRPPGLGANR